MRGRLADECNLKKHTVVESRTRSQMARLHWIALFFLIAVKICCLHMALLNDSREHFWFIWCYNWVILSEGSPSFSHKIRALYQRQCLSTCKNSESKEGKAVGGEMLKRREKIVQGRTKIKQCPRLVLCNPLWGGSTVWLSRNIHWVCWNLMPCPLNLLGSPSTFPMREMRTRGSK